MMIGYWVRFMIGCQRQGWRIDVVKKNKAAKTLTSNKHPVKVEQTRIEVGIDIRQALIDERDRANSDRSWNRH